MGITIRNQLKLFWGEQKGAYQWDFSQQPMAIIDVSFFFKDMFSRRTRKL
jgi:hypothetical protein